MSLLLGFRIGVTGSATPEQDFGADVNDFWSANGNVVPVFQGSVGALVLGSCDFVQKSGVVAARVDFEFDNPYALAFQISDPVPLGLHVNALISQKVDNAEALLKAQLLDWFAYTANGYPVCPGLVSYTNPPQTYTPPPVNGVAQPTINYAGGQSWKRTPRGSVLISPDPARWRRR